MNGIFEKGQGEKFQNAGEHQLTIILAYVALSRATSLEGLQVLNFDQERYAIQSGYPMATQTGF
jgi:hypothetical protein